MKKFLIAGSSLAAVAAAGSAGAVDVTLGGSIDMGVEFGVGKNKSSLGIGEAYNTISLSLAAAGTTDAGMRYGGSFTLATADELEFNAYDTNTLPGDDNVDKALIKMTVSGATDIEAAAYNVSGGQMLKAASIVGVKINSDWMSVGDTQTGYALDDIDDPLAGKDICKVAGIVPDAPESVVTIRSVSRLTADGKAAVPANLVQIVDGYLPAGKVVTGSGLGDLKLTAEGWETEAVSVTASGKVAHLSGVDEDGAPAETTVTADSVFAGPFMEVKLQSS